VLKAIEEAKAQGKGAVSLFGKMIDAPIVLRARQTLALAAAVDGKGRNTNE
jgi:citrate lyase subunit beta/citryl-CoA lyase